MIVLGRALHLSPPSRNAIEGIRMPDSVSFKVCPIFWKSFQFLSSSWRKGMRNCGWAGVFLCAISGYLFKIARVLFPVPLQPPFSVLLGKRDHYVGWLPFALRLRPPPVLCAGSAGGAAKDLYVCSSLRGIPLEDPMGS